MDRVKAKDKKGPGRTGESVEQERPRLNKVKGEDIKGLGRTGLGRPGLGRPGHRSRIESLKETLLTLSL